MDTVEMKCLNCNSIQEHYFEIKKLRFYEFFLGTTKVKQTICKKCGLILSWVEEI